MSTILDEYVTSLVNAAVTAIDGFKCIVVQGVDMGEKIKEATNKAIKAYNNFKIDRPKMAEQVIRIVNFIFVNKLCLNGFSWSLHTSFMKYVFVDVDKYNVHIEICVKIISIIFDQKDITEMMGYLETYDSNKITPSIAEKIDKLLETAEQIVELITIDSDAPVNIALPSCLSENIENSECKKEIEANIKTCSLKIRDENNKKNPETRKALFRIINEYKSDPSKSEDENNQKRMKLILVIAFILKLYTKTSEEGYDTWRDVGDEDEDEAFAYPKIPGGNRIKSRRDKSRRNKSRRNKSRRNNKSRRTRK
jgi:hypothetical protein